MTTANTVKESFAYLLSESADGTVNGTGGLPMMPEAPSPTDRRRNSFRLGLPAFNSSQYQCSNSPSLKELFQFVIVIVSCNF